MQDNETIIAEHKRDKDESVAFKERRFKQWNENYSLYRDKVNTNRLTQRQPVNVPIIRETISSWISKIDEPPKLKFETRGKTNKNKTGEILVNEIYKYYYDRLNLDILDNVDKKLLDYKEEVLRKLE